MLYVDGNAVSSTKFPDGSLNLKLDIVGKTLENKWRWDRSALITWKYGGDEELAWLWFLAQHLRQEVKHVSLFMPYVPYARMDRTKNPMHEVFTLKHICAAINMMEFDRVTILDPHSNVTPALLNNVEVLWPTWAVGSAEMQIRRSNDGEKPLFFYPDEGAMKKYSSIYPEDPYIYGQKVRDWETGRIKGLNVITDGQTVRDRVVLMVDDISSFGGTFYHSAKALKDLGAKKVYLHVTHCENSILQGDLIKSGLVEKIFTTDSLFTGSHDLIEVMSLVDVEKML